MEIYKMILQMRWLIIQIKEASIKNIKSFSSASLIIKMTAVTTAMIIPHIGTILKDPL